MSLPKDDLEVAVAEKLGDIEPSTKVEDARILRKLDIRLIPMLAALYLMSFLDRGNIGNAKIEGLATDLHMNGSQYDLTRKNTMSISSLFHL
jgi:hypothetical protein